MRLALLVTLVLASPAPLTAQAHQHHDAGARPAADIGRVAFPISCRPAAPREFERGMALLHSFW